MIECRSTSEGVVEPQRTLPVEDEYDVVVVGGGMAGVGAGIAAARAGCRILIIERESALGGLATVGLVNIPCDFLSGIGREMFSRLKEVKGLWNRHSDPEKHKLVLDRMVQESGCDILLVMCVVEAIVKNGCICGVVVESKAGRKAIMAKRVIDCSGDADAAYFAGCECNVGRPSDGFTQGCSLEFRLGGVDWDELRAKNPQWLDLIKTALANGDLPYEVDNHLNWITHVPGRPEHCGMDEVSICFAHSRNCRPLDNHDLTRMYLEGREQADFLWKFIKKYAPGFENCWLIDTAPLLGVRDTRRVLGEYVLTALDVASSRRFDDVITISSHGFDIHNPTGPGNIRWAEVEIKGEMRYVVASPGGFSGSAAPPGGKDALCDYKGRSRDAAEFPKPIVFDIPYRCLVPQDVDNLLVAGRCLSADFAAQSAARLIMACLAMGEAAGNATALSLKHNIPPRKVDRVEIQRALIENGGNLGQKFRAIPGVTE